MNNTERIMEHLQEGNICVTGIPEGPEKQVLYKKIFN